MRNKPFVHRLVNFLLGFSWALALIGALSTFRAFYGLGWFTSLLGGAIGALPGVLLAVWLEYLLFRIEKTEEIIELLKKQSH